MAVIRVSVEEMGVAAGDCDRLAQDIGDCLSRLQQLNSRLQGQWEGQSAQSFDGFVGGTATPILNRCMEMCSDTARAIRHTCQQFTEADGTLSGTFNV